MPKSIDRYRALVDAIPDFILCVYHDGVCVDIKQDITDGDIQNAGKKGHLRLQERFPAALATKILEHSKAALICNQTLIFEYDLQENGEQHIFEARIVPTNNEEVLMIGRDITERKQIESALSESEERYRTLVELSPDAIFINRDNQIVYANPACVHLLGAISANEILGKSPFLFIHPTGHDKAKARISQMMERGGSVPKVENRFVRVDGVVIDVEAVAQTIQDHGKVATQFVWRDISERKQTEAENTRLLEEVTHQRLQLRALNQRMAEIQDMERKALARELHDQVSSNLSLLAINLKLLQNRYTEDLEGSHPDHVTFKNLQSSLQQISERIRDVMADLWPPVLDDYGLFAALDWYSERLAHYNSLLIHLKGEELQPRLNTVVEQTLFRIAQEALTNVVKHAQATEITIRLISTASMVSMAVIDNGCGIDTTRANGTLREPNWGMLNMRERAQAIGGDLRVVSSKDAGTSIIVEVPLDNRTTAHKEVGA